MKYIIFYVSIFLISCNNLNAQSVDLYFSISENDSKQCKFGDIEGCRLFKVPVTLYRNGSSGLLDSVILDKNNFSEIFSGVAGVQPNVNSDNTYMTFLCTKDTLGFLSQHIYVHELGKMNVFDATVGQTFNNRGMWPIWYNDSTLLYTSSNNCVPSSNPGCGVGSRYNDFSFSKLNSSLTLVDNTTTVWGDVNSITNLDSKWCSFEDPVESPNNPNLIAFHSSPNIGGTTYPTIPIDCPFTFGVPTNLTTPGAEPQPIVVKMDAVVGTNLIKDLIPSVDYWKFDLASAGLNGLAHLDWYQNDVIIGTEQGSLSTNNYKVCSDTIYGSNISACIANGGHVIIYDRPWGFELDTVNGMYSNIYRNTNPQQPLFNSKHPAQLPKSSLFWNPAIDICASYRTAKQIQFCGSETTIIATVFCKATTSTIQFSRMYLIDFADYNNPFYFDITGWVEDNFPGRWADGQATAYTATCFTTNHITSITELTESNQIKTFPNPTTGKFIIGIEEMEKTEISIFNSTGQLINIVKKTNEIDLSEEPNGLYFILICSENKIYRTKIIKQN